MTNDDIIVFPKKNDIEFYDGWNNSSQHWPYIGLLMFIFFFN